MLTIEPRLRSRPTNPLRRCKARSSFPVRMRQSIPADLAGKWVAWSSDGLRIVASGASLAEVRDTVRQKTQGHVIYEKLRRPPVAP